MKRINDQYRKELWFDEIDGRIIFKQKIHNWFKESKEKSKSEGCPEEVLELTSNQTHRSQQNLQRYQNQTNRSHQNFQRNHFRRN